MQICPIDSKQVCMCVFVGWLCICTYVCGVVNVCMYVCMSEERENGRRKMLKAFWNNLFKSE